MNSTNYRDPQITRVQDNLGVTGYCRVGSLHRAASYVGPVCARMWQATSSSFSQRLYIASPSVRAHLVIALITPRNNRREDGKNGSFVGRSVSVIGAVYTFRFCCESAGECEVVVDSVT